MSQPVTIARTADSELVASLAKLWPHREHESNAIKNFFCSVGFHRWRQLDLSKLHPGKEVRYCFWCPKIKVDGVIYHP
jgi:hypothetical protein